MTRCPHCSEYLENDPETGKLVCPEPSCGVDPKEDQPPCFVSLPVAKGSSFRPNQIAFVNEDGEATNDDGFERAADCLSGYGNE